EAGHGVRTHPRRRLPDHPLRCTGRPARRVVLPAWGQVHGTRRQPLRVVAANPGRLGGGCGLSRRRELTTSKQTLKPLTGTLRPPPSPAPEPGEPALLFDIDIPVRFALRSPVAPGLFPRPEPVAQVSLEDVDLGVSDWRDLAGKEVAFPRELDQSDA